MIFLIENPFNRFLQDNALWIALSFAFLILLTIGIIFISGKKQTKAQKVDGQAFTMALGGKENIISCSAKGSRLTIALKDISLLDEGKLKSNGVLSLIKMTQKLILVVAGKAEGYLSYLR